jgi:hypothetical protein
MQSVVIRNAVMLSVLTSGTFENYAVEHFWYK